MSARLPVPLTITQVQAQLNAMGGLCLNRALCPPFRGDHEEAREYGPLVTDAMWAWMNSEDEGEWCERRGRAEAWLSARGM